MAYDAPKEIAPKGQYQLAARHSLTRNWHNEKCEIEGTTIGLELEMEAHRDRYPICVAAHANGGIAERDATLDGQRGVEVVFPPFSAKTILTRGSPLAKFLKEIEDHAPLDMPENCGNHINVGCKKWDKAKKVLFLHFFQSAAKVCNLMADRDRYRYRYFRPEYHDNIKTAQEYPLGNHGHGSNCGWRYDHVESERMEIVIFRGTRDPQKIKERVQFICAVEGFVEYLLEKHPKDFATAFRTVNRLYDSDCKAFFDWLEKETTWIKYRAFKNVLAVKDPATLARFGKDHVAPRKKKEAEYRE